MAEQPSSAHNVAVIVVRDCLGIFAVIDGQSADLEFEGFCRLGIEVELLDEEVGLKVASTQSGTVPAAVECIAGKDTGVNRILPFSIDLESSFRNKLKLLLVGDGYARAIVNKTVTSSNGQCIDIKPPLDVLIRCRSRSREIVLRRRPHWRR